MVTDPILVALRVAEALDKCGVPYLVGGSLASSIVGEPRSTLDIDLVVALAERQIEPLLEELGDEFYADAEALRHIVGIVLNQQGTLDEAYLRRSARLLGVIDLLERALGSAA